MDKVKVTPSTKKERVLAQFNLIKDRPYLSQRDERLKKSPLKYFTEYLKTNVLPSVKNPNSKEDILGRFYGEFIRFSGGEGQTLGVVLTPAHITELFCDLVEITPEDRVFDPCCGTAGFLIAAMHEMVSQAKTEKEADNIKKEQLYGFEIREDMFAIATTNMILRGDGKSNLDQFDFLKQNAVELRKKNLTVGFMNPPYSQAKGKDTAHLSEIHFIKHLLDSLANGGRCVVIVPQSTMVGKTKEDKKVKEQILRNHSKHIGLTKTERAISQKQQLLDCWLRGKPAESRFMVKTTIEPSDEWLHSFYYFNDEIPTEADFEKTIADYLTFEFSMVMQGREYLFNNKEDLK
jgi:type I restriction-modification system DNA methylase subunit